MLIYHRVLTKPDFMRPSEPTAERFECYMRLLSQWFNPLPLREAVARLYAGDLPPRAVTVTFDDGYADNLYVAAPILKKWGVPGTVFVASGFVGEGLMWNDRVIEAIAATAHSRLDLSCIGLGERSIGTALERFKTAGVVLGTIKHLHPSTRDEHVEAIASQCGVALPSLMLKAAELRALHESGIEIGGHTQNHPILSALDDELALREIANGKRDLEQVLQSGVSMFAYPNGRPGRDYTARHCELVRSAGFEAAFSTQPACATDKSDRWQISRFTPWDESALRYGIRLLYSRFRARTTPRTDI